MTPDDIEFVPPVIKINFRPDGKDWVRVSA